MYKTGITRSGEGLFLMKKPLIKEATRNLDPSRWSHSDLLSFSNQQPSLGSMVLTKILALVVIFCLLNGIPISGQDIGPSIVKYLSGPLSGRSPSKMEPPRMKCDEKVNSIGAAQETTEPNGRSWTEGIAPIKDQVTLSLDSPARNPNFSPISSHSAHHNPTGPEVGDESALMIHRKTIPLMICLDMFKSMALKMKTGEGCACKELHEIIERGCGILMRRISGSRKERTDAEKCPSPDNPRRHHHHPVWPLIRHHHHIPVDLRRFYWRLPQKGVWVGQIFRSRDPSSSVSNQPLQNIRRDERNKCAANITHSEQQH